jgi:glycosyltransferase involved in cell wall biosynthesis
LINADIIGRTLGQWLGRPVVSTLQNEPQNYDRARFDQRWLERLTARYLPVSLVAVSKHVRTMFVEQWHIPKEKIGVIYNAVAMKPYLAIPVGPNRNKNDEGPVIINVASLSEQKAQARLLEAAKLVLAEYPKARFMIVGRGRLEQKLKDYARTLGIAEQVIFTGLRHDIPDLLARADIFVLSSLWEGLPLAAVEAMAAARPVILTDVGGNSELVEHGQNGLLAPPGDVEALAGAIRLLLADPEQRLILGQAARAQVRHDFNIEMVVKQYETLYEALLRERSLQPAQPELELKGGHEEVLHMTERVYNE